MFAKVRAGGRRVPLEGSLWHGRMTSEEIARLVDDIKARPEGRADELVPLLSERHPVYHDRPGGQAIHIRGYAMAALEFTGVPVRVLPHVLEALESGQHPYLVAAAARALRSLERPHPQIAPFFVKAIFNIWRSDNPVNYGNFHVEWPQREVTTALGEVFATLARFAGHGRLALADLQLLEKSHGDKFSDAARRGLTEAIVAIEGDEIVECDDGCCAPPSALWGFMEHTDVAEAADVPGDLLIEDQEGGSLKWSEFFTGKPTVLAFFYTRCMNPRKCTQTMQNLAAIRKGLEDEGLSGKVRMAAITYDPAFDSAGVLKSFGAARRLPLDDDMRLFRVPKGFGQVVGAFQLGVGFTGTQVNSHRVELFVLDENGGIARSFLSIQSDPGEVIEVLRELVSRGTYTASPPRRGGGGRRRVGAGSSVLLGVLVAVFPKCPVCWVSYASVLGVVGVDRIPYSPWLLPVLAVMLGVNLCYLYRSSATRNGLAPFAFSLVGGVLLMLSIPGNWLPPWLGRTGLGLLLLGSLLQALSYPVYNRLKRWVFDVWLGFSVAVQWATGRRPPGEDT